MILIHLKYQSETIFEDDNKEDSEKTNDDEKQNLTQKKAVKIRMMFLTCQF